MIDQLKRLTGIAAALFALAIVAQPASAAIWSNTELHMQLGTLDTPTFAGGGDQSTTIFTLQHASGWKYGDNFFFFDVISGSGAAGFNNYDTYGEWYSYFSFRKLAGKEEMKGALKDVRFIAGFNWAPDADVRKYLPGIGLSWNAPGFAFLNTDFTLYIDDSVGIVPNGGGAPSEDDYLHDRRQLGAADRHEAGASRATSSTSARAPTSSAGRWRPGSWPSRRSATSSTRTWRSASSTSTGRTSWATPPPTRAPFRRCWSGSFEAAAAAGCSSFKCQPRQAWQPGGARRLNLSRGGPA